MKKLKLLFLFSIFIFILTGCRKDTFKSNSQAFDIILVMGQSNTHYGTGFDFILDKPSDQIKQLGRYDTSALKIIPAKEPLHHHTRKKNTVGFALTFAKLYADKYLEEDRQVLIIPCGRAGAAFFNNRLNKGDDLYNDAVTRVQFILTNYPNSELAAIVWHQGESDVGHLDYEENLDKFIKDLRKDLRAEKIPFILGGMVPGWVSESEERIQQQAIIKDTPNRIERTGYADPTLPFVIEGDSTLNQGIHYNSIGLRELGHRYFEVYEAMR